MAQTKGQKSSSESIPRRTRLICCCCSDHYLYCLRREKNISVVHRRNDHPACWLSSWLHIDSSLRCCRTLFFLVVTKDALPEVWDHHRKTFTKGYLRFPAEEILSLCNIRFSLVRVIFCVRPEFYPCTWVDGFLDHLKNIWGLLVCWKQKHVTNNTARPLFFVLFRKYNSAIGETSL